MSRKFGWSVCVALLLALGLWFALPSAPERPRITPPSPPLNSTDSPPDVAEFPETNAIETAGHTVDLEAGAAAFSGVVSLPDGRAAAGADVFLYRSQLPTDIEDSGGISLWRLVDLGRGGAGALSELGRTGRFPFRPEIARGLEKLAAVQADPTGLYRFSGLSSGSYLVAAQAEGTLLTPTPTVHHLAESETRVDVPLREAGTLSGSVVGDDGSTIASARIRIVGEVVPVEAGFEAMYVARDDLLVYLLNSVTAVADSDAEGNFRFTGLPFLDYRIFVDAQPWAAAEKEQPVPEPAPIEIVLEVGGTLEGVVSDPDGAPVAGVEVALTIENGGAFGGAGALRIPVDTVTDGEGRFRFIGLAAETYRVTVEGSGWLSTRVNGLLVESGGTREVEVTLEPGSVLTGVVRDAEGNPIADVRVRSVPYDTGGPRTRGETETNARGEFTIDTVPSGEYALRCTLDGWLESEVDAMTDGPPIEVTMERGPLVTGVVVDKSEQPVPRARLEISQGWNSSIRHECEADGRFSFTISSQDAITLVVRCAGFAELRVEVPAGGGDLGELVLEDALRIGGVVFDPDGAPLPGARVTASREAPSQNQQWRSVQRSITGWTDAEGSFSLEADDPYATFKLRAAYPLLLPSEELEIPLAGQSVTGIEIGMRWGASLFGQVTGPTNLPIDGATIDIRLNSNRNGRRRATARTSGSGEFQIAGLVAGTYLMRVSAPRHASLVVPEVLLGVDEARRFDLRLGPEERLIGFVINERGEAIDRARISVSEKDAVRRSGTSDPTGAYVIDRLGRGELTVTTDAEGFLRYREKGILAADGPLEIVMRRAYEVRGTVLDQGTGEPIRGARAQITLAEENPRSRSRRRWERTDREGNFEIDGLDVGEYRLDISADGYVPFAVTDVTVPPRPSEEDIVVFLRAGGRVRGTIYDPVGRPLTRARIRAYRLPDEPAGDAPPRRGRPDAQARSADDGTYSLIGLLEGRYTVQYSHEEHLEETREVLISLEQPEPLVTVTLERGGSIEGRVYDSGGSILESGNVSLRGPLRRRVRLRDGGAYRFAGLPPGSYTVEYVVGRNNPAGTGAVEVQLPARGTRTIDLHLP